MIVMKDLEKQDTKRILKLLKKHYGQTTTALTFKTPFQLLLSTMLAAQSTDVRVNIVTKDLFKKYPDAKSFLKLSVEELEEKIKTVGLYKTKAKNILDSCRLIINKYKGQIPTSREELMKLPGVGRKTANVVLSIAHNVDAIAVDTHVFRVSNRIGLANSKNVNSTEQELMVAIPQKDWSAAHHWLIWHGRKICKARNPLCKQCFLNQHCVYFESTFEN